MNIYQMYYENNKRFGFYVIRDSWGNFVAKITGIENVIEGEEIDGIPPYYGNQKVYAEFFNVKDANDLEYPSIHCHKGNMADIGELSCPGTYAYELVE